MRTIIAGSRSIDEYAMVCHVLESVPWEITEVVCGMAPGVDIQGKRWADEAGITVVPFKADWDNIEVPGAAVRYHKNGKPYNAAAGVFRNQYMADYAEALAVLWDGESPGTMDMVKRAYKNSLRFFMYNAITDEVLDEYPEWAW